VVLLVKVSAMRKEPVALAFVESRQDLIVMLVALVTAAVAVRVNCKSTYEADALIADPPVVVKPLMEVQVVLS